MEGAEMEDEGSVLKYMTKSEIEEQRSSLLIMTQRRYCWNCRDVYTHPNRNVLSKSAPLFLLSEHKLLGLHEYFCEIHKFA